MAPAGECLLAIGGAQLLNEVSFKSQCAGVSAPALIRQLFKACCFFLLPFGCTERVTVLRPVFNACKSSAMTRNALAAAFKASSCSDLRLLNWSRIFTIEVAERFAFAACALMVSSPLERASRSQRAISSGELSSASLLRLPRVEDLESGSRLEVANVSSH